MNINGHYFLKTILKVKYIKQLQEAKLFMQYFTHSNNDTKVTCQGDSVKDTMEMETKEDIWQSFSLKNYGDWLEQ